MRLLVCSRSRSALHPPLLTHLIAQDQGPSLFRPCTLYSRPPPTFLCSRPCAATLPAFSPAARQLSRLCTFLAVATAACSRGCTSLWPTQHARLLQLGLESGVAGQRRKVWVHGLSGVTGECPAEVWGRRGEHACWCGAGEGSMPVGVGLALWASEPAGPQHLGT